MLTAVSDMFVEVLLLDRLPVVNSSGLSVKMRRRVMSGDLISFVVDLEKNVTDQISNICLVLDVDDDAEMLRVISLTRRGCRLSQTDVVDSMMCN